MLWALILAVALYPLHQSLAGKLGNKQGRASTLMVLVTMLLIGVPMGFLALTVVHDVQTAHAVMESGGLEIPAPDPSVADWPVIGERAYSAWDTAATSMEQFQASYGPQLKDLTKKVLGASLGAVGAALLFLASMVVAGIMMAFGKGGVMPCCESPTDWQDPARVNACTN